MYKPSKRARRVSDLLQREIAGIVLREVNDPRLASLSVTRVEISPDLGNAKIFFTLLDPIEKTEAGLALKKASGFIRHALAGKTDLKYLPQLHFVYDEFIEHAERLTAMIDQV